MVEEKKSEEKKDEEDCEACKIAAGVEMATDICKIAQDEKIKLDCKDLMKQVADGKLKPFDLVKQLKEAFKEKPEVIEDLEITELLMQGKSEEEITKWIEERAKKAIT